MSRGSPHKRRPWRVSFPMYTLNIWIGHGQAGSERRRGASLALFPCFGFVPRPKDSDMTRAGCVRDTEYCCTGYCCCTGYGIQDSGYRIQAEFWMLSRSTGSISKFGYISREFHSDCWMFVFDSLAPTFDLTCLLLTSTSAASASEVSLVGWSRLTKRVGWSFLRKLHPERESVHLCPHSSLPCL